MNLSVEVSRGRRVLVGVAMLLFVFPATAQVRIRPSRAAIATVHAQGGTGDVDAASDAVVPPDMFRILQVRTLRLFDLAMTAASLHSCESISLARDACMQVVSYAEVLDSYARRDLTFESSSRSTAAFMPAAVPQPHSGVGTALRFCNGLFRALSPDSSTPVEDHDNFAVAGTTLGRYQEGQTLASVRAVSDVCHYPPLPTGVLAAVLNSTVIGRPADARVVSTPTMEGSGRIPLTAATPREQLGAGSVSAVEMRAPAGPPGTDQREVSAVQRMPSTPQGTYERQGGL